MFIKFDTILGFSLVILNNLLSLIHRKAGTWFTLLITKNIRREYVGAKNSILQYAILLSPHFSDDKVQCREVKVLHLLEEEIRYKSEEPGVENRNESITNTCPSL